MHSVQKEKVNMSVKLRKIKVESNKGQFCSSCLKSKETGEKELFQIRIRNEGCVFDFYLCKECINNLNNEMDALSNDFL